MLPFADADGFTVAPSALLVVSSLLVLCVLAAVVVTALKGRWAWLVIGMLTAGLACLYSAFLPAVPGSIWARRGKAAG